MIVRDAIPGRSHWSLGTPISDGPGHWRIAVSHDESSYAFWVHGPNRAAWLTAAEAGIDAVLEARWQAMAELIDEADFYGPNVRILR